MKLSRRQALRSAIAAAAVVHVPVRAETPQSWEQETDPEGMQILREVAENLPPTLDPNGAPEAQFEALVSYAATVPTGEEVDPEAVVDGGALTLRDPLLFASNPEEAGLAQMVEFTDRWSGAVVSTTGAGWKVVPGSQREFRDFQSRYVFTVAAVRDSRNREAVILSRGVNRVQNGRVTVSWERRVILRETLAEFLPQLSYMKGFFDDMWNKFKDALDKLWDKIKAELPKWIEKAIDALLKAVSKWLKEQILKLLVEPKTSAVSKEYLGHLGQNKATAKAVEHFVATTIVVRTSNYTLSDRVYLALSAPVTRINDSRAADSLAKMIETLR